METLPNLICGKFTVGGKDNLPPDNYADIFEQDLVEAEKKVIISSPQITQDKIDRMIYITSKRIEAGCKISVITLNPEDAAYGSAEYQYSMIRQMEEAGIQVILKDEVNEHFALIDEELVWRGVLP